MSHICLNNDYYLQLFVNHLRYMIMAMPIYKLIIYIFFDNKAIKMLIGYI